MLVPCLKAFHSPYLQNRAVGRDPRHKYTMFHTSHLRPALAIKMNAMETSYTYPIGHLLLLALERYSMVEEFETSSSTHVNVFHKYPATTVPRAGMIIGSQPSRRNPSESLPKELRRKDSIILRLRQKNSGLCGNDAKNQDERHWPRQPISPNVRIPAKLSPQFFGIFGKMPYFCPQKSALMTCSL